MRTDTARPRFGEDGFDYTDAPDEDLTIKPTGFLQEAVPGLALEEAQLVGYIAQHSDDPIFCAFLRNKANHCRLLRIAMERELERRGARPENVARSGRPDDLGVEVLRAIHSSLQVDHEWCTWSDRGFRWWGYQHAQDVWSDEAIDDEGIIVYRLHARTEIVREFEPTPAKLDAIALFNSLNVMSALVAEPDTGCLVYHATAWVHEGSADWMTSFFAGVAAMQASMANAQGVMLGGLFDAPAATSPHPKSGWRTNPDDMMGINQHIVVPRGQLPSAWAGEDLVAVGRMLRASPYCVLANGNETAVTAEFPVLGRTTLLTATTCKPHITLGNGLLLGLALPGTIDGSGGEWANTMNLTELSSRQTPHLLGSWTVSDGTPTFVAFLPNLLATRKGLAANLVFPFVRRARWFAEQMRGDQWDRPGRMDEARGQRSALDRVASFSPAGKAAYKPRPPRWPD